VEEVPLDKLPPKVSEHLKTFNGVEVLAATREREGDRECYTVTVLEKGKKADFYVARDGRFSGRKEDNLSAHDLPGLLLGSLLLGVFPGAIGAAVARFGIQQVRPGKSSVLLEWLAAWCGAALVFAMLWLMVNTIPREKNPILIVFSSSVWGGVSASIVEVFVLTIRSIRGRRNSSRLWILAFCLTGVAFLGLSIPVEIYHRAWSNQYYKAIALSHDREE